MVGFNSERLESAAYRASIGQLLSQFMYGEEVSYTVAPIVMEHFESDSGEVAALQAQLDDEVRHHGMFDEQRQRLSLPFEPPCDGMVDLGDRIRGMMNHGDIVGLLFAGSFMLEGLAFTTLSAYSEVSEPEMGKMLVDIMEDEGRHISLNMSLLKRLMDQDPSVAPRLVELHRETLPALFKIFSPKIDLARDAGLDGAWLLTRSMFHHAQRIRRLHLSRDMAHTMLEDSARVLASRS